MNDPNLKKALANLETFSQQIERDLVPSLFHLKLQEGKLVADPHTSLKKTIALAYKNLALSKEDHQSAVLNEILHSSDIIKSYLPLIMKEGGTPEQQKFADYAKKAIERFNLAIDKARSLPPTWQTRIVRFLYQKSGLLISNRLVKIELPQKAYVHIDFPHQTSKASLKPIKIHSALQNQRSNDLAAQKISSLREMVIPAFQVQQQTLELYHMKVIALLERHQLLPNLEARSIVIKTPIQLALDKQEQLLTISQRLIPLPGQQIEVAVTFRMDPRTLTFSIFDSDNLSLEANQTGFPHPSQHHGWALSEVLFPGYLHRPHELRLFPKLYQDKLTIAQALLPNGSLADKARSFLRLKRQIFDQNKLVFLKYHQALCFAMAEAASNNGVPENFSDRIHPFFEALANQPNPYDLISKVYEQLMFNLIKLPYGALEQAWLNGELSAYEEAKRLLAKEMESHKGVQEAQAINHVIQPHSHLFKMAMHQLLAPAIQELILLQQSEIMQFPPPKLNLFAKKIQTAVYLQLWEFHHELSLELNETDLFRRLSRLLEDDIMLFKTEDLSYLNWHAVAVVQELEAYYEGRALS